MPKHGALTPKAIANRIKAKGLQKLRWYCQMCQKQCRDENGFKCHTMSESHQRQLLLFAEDPDKYIDNFSQEFLESFMELLKRRFGTKRIHANQVYQEYIADRQHLHMNATQWETLTEFVKWMGREGYVIADNTEKGWFITYIDRDPETIRRQEAVAKKEKMEKDDEDRMAKFLQQQIERGKQQIKNVKESHYTECIKENEDEKIEFSFKAQVKKAKEIEKQNALIKTSSSKEQKERTPKSSTSEAKKRSALDDLIEEQEKVKEKKNRKDYWLTPGIIVKVLSQKLGDRYFKKKGVVQDVLEKYAAVVKMIDSGHILKLDQSYLETVIPAIGKKVLVVNGAYRGEVAKVTSISLETFSVNIEIDSGPLRGRTVNNIKYEDISKLYDPS